MLRRFLRPAVAFLVLLALLGTARTALAFSPDNSVAAIHAAESATVAQIPEPRSARTCADLVTSERQLDREIAGLLPSSSLGAPRLCLLYYPTDDIYRAVLLAVDGASHFRAVKADAVRRLQDAAFDVCGIGQWGTYGRVAPADRYLPDDFVELPVECRPRVVAMDPDAAVFLGGVRAAVDRMQEATARQMDWRPNRPLTIQVIADLDVAITVYKRFISSASLPEQLARAGRSQSVRTSIFGGLILVNMAKSRDVAAVERLIAHEYTHFAQGGIGSSNDFFPKWLIEGQAVYQEVRNSDSAADVRYVDIATAAQRSGTALHLAEISRVDDWNAREATQEGIDANYSAAYVAVAFLIERFGFDATVQFFRDNRNGNFDRFYQLLGALTGMDLDTLDRTVGVWLLGLPSFVGADTEGTYHLEVTAIPGGLHTRGRLIFDETFACGNSRLLRAGIAYTVSARLQPDGSFSGTFTFADTGAIASLDGRFVDTGEVEATFRYVNATTGCDTGPLTVVAVPAEQPREETEAA